MMKMMMFMSSMMININMVKANHPLFMTLMIIMQTIVVATYSGLITESFWMSYILLLIFLGGMMILFIYVTSIAANEILSMKNTMKMNMLIMVTTIMLIMVDKYFINLDMINSEMMYSQQLEKEMASSMNKLFNSPMNNLTILMMVYLFFMLVVIVKMTDIKQGPIRSKMYEQKNK
uniref:NADH-ubiquinone oxidoreductase chain 6 n=1 Tax=Chorotypus fenestratus TaxID=1564101 RepID=A0A0N7AS35_9ORTH|nr:NADH dehydrogenase subunit 6 [Chorotypus fenestratus]